jgi:hypothetical protein
MYTNQAATVLDSLRSIAGSDESAQALQAFANCNASLSHRGNVSFAAQQFPNQAGVMRPLANGGGVSGVSRGGGGATLPQQLVGGVYSPDATATVPPWGLGAGVGSGMTFPTSTFYGGNYYGAGVNGVDLGHGTPSVGYLAQLNGGGDYYDNSSYYGAGDNIQNSLNVNNQFIEMVSRAGDYVSSWNTVNNNSYFNFPGPTITNNQTYNYGGDTVNIAGDTILGDTYINVGGGGAGAVGPAGAAGAAGADGRQGDPGAVGPAGPAGRDGDPGGIVVIGVPGGGGGAGGGQIGGKVENIALLSNFLVELQKKTFSVVTGATFNPETCEVETDKADIECVVGVVVKPAFDPPRRFRVA